MPRRPRSSIKVSRARSTRASARRCSPRGRTCVRRPEPPRRASPISARRSRWARATRRCASRCGPCRKAQPGARALSSARCSTPRAAPHRPCAAMESHSSPPPARRRAGRATRRSLPTRDVMKRPSRFLLSPLFVAPVCLAWAASTAPAPRAGGEDALKPSDHESLGKVIAGFKDASRNNKNVDKARADVAKELDKLRTRLKGRDPLSLTTDLGKALWESLNYDSAKNVKKGKVSETKFKDADFDLTYATWAPAHYEPKKAYPLILCIPDKGEKPSEHLTEKWIGQEIRENVVLAAVPMPEDVAQWGEPGTKERGWGGAANLYTVFREVSLTYGTDFDRGYIAGRGVGVAAVL